MEMIKEVKKMATCPNCGRDSRQTRTMYADPIDDIIEVMCEKCGPSLVRIPPPWVGA